MATLRPDGRLFAAADELVEVVASHNGPVHLNCDLSDQALVALCAQLNMKTEVESTSYRVPFAGVLERLPSRDASPAYEIVRADQVNADALFALDIALRQHVPGTNGWTGNRDWFDAELASPEFDPSGYLAARHQATASLVGLIRLWRQPNGPKLGMLAVLPQHRRGYVASALFRAGLLGAADWGFTHFETSTARPALQRRLQRSGATVTGNFAQLVTTPMG